MSEEGNDASRCFIKCFCVFLICVIIGISFNLYLQNDLDKEAIKAGLEQRQVGYGKVIWVKPNQSENKNIEATK